MQTYQNYTRLLIRDYESQKILDRCYKNTKKTQMPTQATLPNKTLTYHRWSNQCIPGQNQIHTISFDESNPSQIIKGKLQHKEENDALKQKPKRSPTD